MTGLRWFVFFLTLLLSSGVRSETPNVALNKEVVGSGKWQPCAVDGKFHTTFAPSAVQFPYYFVDLGAVYNLTSINLFCQNEGTFYDQGVNVPFDVHTYDQFMSECGYERHYPWDVLAKNLTFKRKGEEIVLRPEKPVQYIIIGRQNDIYPRSVQPIVIGEVQAHGEKLREADIPEVPKDDRPAMPHYYWETRKAVLGTQDIIEMDPSYGYFKPKAKYNDVVFGWYDDPTAMAVVRGKAKMVVVMGHTFIREINDSKLYMGFRPSCRNWLSGGSSKARYMRINSTYDPGDVLLITRDDQFDVEKVYQLLKSGTNSVLAGYPGRDTNDSLTQLLEKMDIEFVKTSLKSSSRFIVVEDSLTSHKYIPISYDIARYVDSWKAFSTESYSVEVSYLGVQDEDTDKELKRLVDKYGPLMERIGPCPRKPYNKNKGTELAVRNYNTLLKYQYGGTNFALPSINHHPGLIPSTVKSTTVVATVYADQAGNFFPLGVYANAGGAFRWTVVKSNRDNYEDQRLRINAHVDSIVKHDSWSRWPYIATDFPLKKQGQYVSPHGGALFLQLPRGVNITIRLEGVYRYPWLDLRNPKSIESFPQELKDYAQPPFLVVHGDSMITMLKTFDVYESGASEVTSSARHFDNAIKVMHNYRGTKWEDVRSEVFVADVQISVGYGHSGYPIMGSIDWSYLFTLWSSSIKHGGQPGFVHEIGHNLQVGEATLLNGNEVTNNVYRLIVDEINLGLNPYTGDMGTGQWSASTYQGPSWGYYRYLGKLFGHGLVGNGFIEARKIRPPNESAKTQFWVKQMCVETGYNMLPFHDMWHFPVSGDTKSTCTKLPCFFPKDQYTESFESKITEVINKYGGNCSRSNPNQVKFRGDIRRGIGVVRSQNIFLTFE